MVSLARNMNLLVREVKEDELIDYILTSMLAEQPVEQTITASIEDMFQADISQIENDRVQIRNQILNNEMRVAITQGGRVFSTQWNSKMNLCTISIPSTWKLSINQATLLDLHQKQFQKAPNIDSKDAPKFGGYIFDLLSRHTDYAVIKKIVELELESHSIYDDAVNKKIYTKFREKNLSPTTAYLLTAFVEQIHAHNTSLQAIKSVLGFRKRLINEIEKVVQ
jgi:hypothetical protein